MLVWCRTCRNSWKSAAGTYIVLIDKNFVAARPPGRAAKKFSTSSQRAPPSHLLFQSAARWVLKCFILQKLSKNKVPCRKNIFLKNFIFFSKYRPKILILKIFKKLKILKKKLKNFENIFSKNFHQILRKIGLARIFYIFSVAVNREPRRAKPGLKSGRNLPELRGVSAFGVPKGHQIRVRKSLNFGGKFHHFRDRT